MLLVVVAFLCEDGGRAAGALSACPVPGACAGLTERDQNGLPGSHHCL